MLLLSSFAQVELETGSELGDSSLRVQAAGGPVLAADAVTPSATRIMSPSASSGR